MVLNFAVHVVCLLVVYMPVCYVRHAKNRHWCHLGYRLCCNGMWTMWHIGWQCSAVTLLLVWLLIAQSLLFY